MTKIFIACLVLFPVMLVGMLLVTGTLQDLVPMVKQQLQALQSDETASSVRVGGGRLDAVDSLLVADLQKRELSIESSMDSLAAMRDRMLTERKELETLSEEVERVIGELQELEAVMATQRDKERKALARIFGEMDAERAADILSLLQEDDVEFLVTSMKRRQAAEVLAMLSPGVAARVSERILQQPADATRGVPQ